MISKQIAMLWMYQLIYSFFKKIANLNWHKVCLYLLGSSIMVHLHNNFVFTEQNNLFIDMIGIYQLLKILTVFPAIPRFRDKDVDNCVWAGITPIPSSFIGPPLAFAFEACSNNPAGKIKNSL